MVSWVKDLTPWALKEDRAWEDITTKSFIPKDLSLKAHVIFKGERAVFCGGDVFRRVFKVFDPKVRVNILVKEGEKIRKGQIVIRLFGEAQSILACERVALNFLCHLTGIASQSWDFVSQAKKHKAVFVISDTRKTHPLLRDLEKYAVKVGGGLPHRRDLSQVVLLKDNHLRLLRGLYEKRWIYFLTKKITHLKQKKLVCEIEAQNLRELRAVLLAKPDWIMLDNMDLGQLKIAVQLIRQKSPKTKIEVSGGITLKNIPRLAKLPIDRVSAGMLTHSSSFANFSLEVI